MFKIKKGIFKIDLCIKLYCYAKFEQDEPYQWPAHATHG